MLRRNVMGIALVLVAGALLVGGDSAYDAEVAKWRKDHDRDVRSDKSPLWLIARHNVPEGRTTIGSDGSSSVLLPERAPKRVGTLERRSDKVTFEPVPGIAIKMNGKPTSGSFALRAGTGPSNPSDKLQFGDFEIALSELRGQYQLTVRDSQSSFAKQFHGSVWFPVNARYRVQGTFTPYSQPKELKIADTSGRTRIRQAPGYVTFRLNGEALRLEPVAVDGALFFMFKDRTSGRETYGSGRFLDTEMPKNGKVVLDFNRAYNPYCAFNPYSSCPIPPRYNTLLTRVEAGEKYRGDH